jgi:putative nucleotidyltransferase with HDIG domain
MAGAANPHYIDTDKLCVGLFIELDLDWVEHPFPFNRFRIKTTAQLEALQALGLKRVRVDPGRSSCPIPAHSAASSRVPEVEPTDVSEAAEAHATHEVNQAKLERLARIKAHHQALDECEKAFRTAAKDMRSIQLNIYAQPEESIERASAMVKQLIQTSINDRQVTISLVNNKLASGEVYDHAMNVMVLGLVIGQQLGLQGEDLQALGLGCIFHDLGKTLISTSITHKFPPLSPHEQRALNQHVPLGIEVGGRIGLEPAVLQIIAEHHERADGSGFPQKLKDEAICMGARIVCVVNDFDNLCNPLNPMLAMNPHEALKLMYAKRRKEYSPIVISQFIRCMGIYPPGTLVALNNGTQGVVVAVNTEQPLKPTVMVYDGSVPRRDAIVLDLSEEADVAIETALSKSALSLEVVSYLNPRSRSSYFTQAQ